MAKATGLEQEQKDKTPLLGGSLATSDMLSHPQICHLCECRKDLRSVAGNHTAPICVVTCRNEQMIKDFLKLAIFPIDEEHKNSRECLSFKIFHPVLFSGNINQITEQLFLPSSSCSLSFSTGSRSFNASLSEHWAFFFFLGYSIQEMHSRKIKQVFVTFHHEGVRAIVLKWRTCTATPIESMRLLDSVSGYKAGPEHILLQTPSSLMKQLLSYKSRLICQVRKPTL